MENWGEYNNRQIFYLSTQISKDWADELPNENWLALIFGNDTEVKLYSELADICVKKNVLYVCTVGLACELIHDIFEETIVDIKIATDQSVESEDDFEDSPMTTWHNDFEEGVWYALTVAYAEKGIDKVIYIDLTKGAERQRVFELIEKIKTGYLPPD